MDARIPTHRPLRLGLDCGTAKPPGFFGVDHYPIRCDFDFEVGLTLAAEWQHRSEQERLGAIRHLWNVASEMTVLLTRCQGTPEPVSARAHGSNAGAETGPDVPWPAASTPLRGRLAS